MRFVPLIPTEPLAAASLGNIFESAFGPDILPSIAIHRTASLRGPFSFGSVRRDQGAFYNSTGQGALIGARNPQIGASEYEFYSFDAGLLDVWIDNDGFARGLDRKEDLIDLKAIVSKAAEYITRQHHARTAA